MAYHCQNCRVEIQGNSQLCVKCYGDLHRPCPQCMGRTASGRLRVKLDRKTREPLDCSHCNNERFVVAF